MMVTTTFVARDPAADHASSAGPSSRAKRSELLFGQCRVADGNENFVDARDGGGSGHEPIRQRDSERSRSPTNLRITRLHAFYMFHPTSLPTLTHASTADPTRRRRRRHRRRPVRSPLGTFTKSAATGATPDQGDAASSAARSVPPVVRSTSYAIVLGGRPRSPSSKCYTSSHALPAKRHMTVPSAWSERRLRLPKGLVLHFADVPKAALTWLGPVPVTTPLRTVADCASADVADDLVRQAVQQGARRGLFDRAEVNAALRRARRERDAAPKLRKP